MKWTIVGLFGLGLVAAIAAAVLVAKFSATDQEIDSPDRPAADVPVVVATKPLESMTIITPDLVTIEMKKRNILPLGSFTDTSQVLSKVLKFDVPKEKILTADDFHTKGSPAELAAALEDGERCVNVALNDTMGIESLLYPGSLVDVLCAMNMDVGTESGDEAPISMTLLENVRVLAIGRDTIVNQAPAGEEGQGGGRAGRPTVALAVSTEQAEKLKLAMQEGSVSLTLRNPLDETKVPERLTGMASLSPLLGGGRSDDSAAMAGVQDRQHKVLIMRGGATEVRTFELR
ncbi:MAG TPA: Flp pilus assembly protein CpaB [Planctomycetota bacterium]|nr:Flp pilus assembly protein CpaB [Planctomycetota bacterium]